MPRNHSDMAAISTVAAREIIDSRGNPTIEVTVTGDDGSAAWASVPSGASTGVHEAHELRDGDKGRYGGKGVLAAVRNVTEEIAPAVAGMDPANQQAIDEKMIALDGTPDKSSLGANAILGVSLAVCRLGAMSRGVRLYRHIAHLAGRDDAAPTLPIPMFNIINGGLHADSGLAIQEFMVVPRGVATFAEQLRAGSEIFHALEKRLAADGFRTGVGNEGGFAPQLPRNEAALTAIEEAARAAGYAMDEQIAIAIDAAASAFYDANADSYELKPEGVSAGAQSLVALYREWATRHALMSVEDGLREDDWEGWTTMNAELGASLMLVGDDLLVTNVTRLQQAIDRGACNAVLIKPNQIGTVTETIACMMLAADAGMKRIVSHRSGDTCDDFIADLAVGMGAEYIKSGAPSRSERTAKYNRLLLIETQIVNA